MSIQQPALPAHVVQAAAQRHLGAHIRGGESQFKGTPAGGCGVAFLFTIAAGAAIGGLFLIIDNKRNGAEIILFIIAGLFFLFGIGSSRANNAKLHWSYVIYQNGFVRWNPGRAEAYTWQDFASARDKIIEYRSRYGKVIERSYQLKLTFKNGGTLKLEGAISHSQTLPDIPVPGIPRVRPTYLQEIAHRVRRATGR